MHRIHLQVVDARLAGPSGPPTEVLEVWIDGAPLLADVRPAYIGFEPADILHSDALLPTDPPRRVAVARCGCGEPGCGALTVMISRAGDQILWRDARDYSGAYSGPLPDEPPNSDGDNDGDPCALPNLAFAADAYLAEVARARAAWSR